MSSVSVIYGTDAITTSSQSIIYEERGLDRVDWSVGRLAPLSYLATVASVSAFYGIEVFASPDSIEE